MKRFFLSGVSLVTLVIISLSTPSALSNVNQDQYLRVKYTTISNPIIQTNSSPQEVNFSVLIETDGYQIEENDLICNDGGSNISAKLIELVKNEYSATCTFKYDNASQTGLRTIYMSTRFALQGAANLRLIPANAKIIYPVKEKDSFGQTVIRNVSAFDMFSRQSAWLGAPVAINPPQNFKYPNFPKVSDAFIVFEARYPQPVDFKVSIDKRSKTFSAKCADQTPPGFKNETKIYRKELLWGGWGPFAISAGKPVTGSYLESPLKGKKVNLSCAYLISLKNPIFPGIQIAYVESLLKTVQFPKK